MKRELKTIASGCLIALFLGAAPAHSAGTFTAIDAKNSLWNTASPLVAKAKTQRTHRAKRSRQAKGMVDVERERMIRECKGRPNAGACLGYAS